MWDIDPPRLRESWAAHQRSTRGIAFGPVNGIASGLFATAGDGPASVGDGSTVQLWLLSCGVTGSKPWKELPSKMRHLAAGVAFSPDGKRITAVRNHPAQIQVWHLPTTNLYRSLRDISDWGYSVGFHPDGTRLVAGLEQTVVLWNPADYRQPTIWSAHTGAVLGVAFTPDGQTLLTGGADGLVKLWGPTGKLRHTFDWKIRDIGAVAFAPDGLTAAAGGVETILVWDVSE